jgi:hypothetical protein
MRRQPLLLSALGLMTVWRWMLLPTQDLSPQEALTAMQASGPWQVSFLQHGPLLTWLGRISMMLGGQGPFGLRLLAPLLAFFTSVMAWHLTRLWFDRTTAGWTVVVLNLLPAFNLAAVSWTPAILLLPTITALPLCLHRATTLTQRWQRDWLLAGCCLAALSFTSPSALLAIATTAALIYQPTKHRPLFKHRGFQLLLALPLPGLLLWLLWQSGHHWPVIANGTWRPQLLILPNWFRWLVLTSPLLFLIILWALRSVWISRAPHPSLSKALCFAIPLAFIDFFWHTNAPWPDTGLAPWLVFAAMLAAHQMVVSPLLQTEDRISWRTITLILAALQAVFLVNSDFIRAVGLPWAFEQKLQHQGSLYPRLFTRDPSGVQRGWQQSGRMLADVLVDTQLKSPQDGRYFVIAAHWPLAAALNRALPAEAPLLWPSPTHPRVHCHQSLTDWSHPFAHLPRYDARSADGTNPFAGKDALYITDDPIRQSPPPELRASFTRTELLTVAHVMHAGEKVRELKIFACYTYRPPQL